jgi:hypothetical protein
MSRGYAGAVCSEGTAPIPFDVPLQAGAFNRFGQQIHRAAEDFAEPPLQAHQTEQSDMGVGIELGREIDVARGAGLVAGGEPNSER